MNRVKFFQRCSGKAIEVQSQCALSERSCRGVSRTQILVRQSRGVEGVCRKYPFNKVTSEGNTKYMFLV